MAGLPTLERLRLLHSVSLHGTIAATARAHAYTPSAVSQQLAALEREVGTQLLERSNRGVILTIAGRVLADRSSSILDAVEAATSEARRRSGLAAPAGLRVAAFPTAISALLLPVVPLLAGQVSIQIVDLEPDDAIAALIARSVDVAIVDRYDDLEDGYWVDDHRLPSSTVLAEPIRLAHPTVRRPRSMSSLADADWVLATTASRLGRATRAICASASIRPRVVAETDDHHVAFDIVRSLGAVTLLPELAVRHPPTGVTVSHAIDTGAVRRIDVVTRLEPTPDDASAILIAAVEAAGAQAKRRQPSSRSTPGKVAASSR